MDLAKVDEIIDSYRGQDGTLISILQDIQAEYYYLPKEALERVSNRLDLPLSQVYSVSTFYTAFSLRPRGRHSIKVCLGTACHVKGAGLILGRLERDLGVKAGETTPDRQFTLETVRCVGCCSLAPVIMVDSTAHGRLKQDSLPKILKMYSARKEGD
ncbi:MAG: NADH-quinone oxidoreductase subunit NuoE [bacterium]